MRKLLQLLLCLTLLFIYPSAFAAYTGLSVNDLGTSTPTENNTKVSEFNNAIREIKTVLKNQWHIGSKTANYTLTSSDSIIHIPSGTWTISVGTPTTVASNDFTKIYIIKNTGTQTASVSANGGKKIEGTTTAYSLAGSASVYLWTDGNDWYELAPQNSASSDNSDLLDNQDSTYYTNASNIATGTVNLDRIPATLTNKDADTIDNINGTSIVQTSRTISTTAPITGGGDLSANRTFAIPQATNSADGYISGTDFNTFNNSRLSSWIVGSTVGTGSVTYVAGAGISLTSTYSDGKGTITVTGVGTTTAGGFLDTGSQSVLTAGYKLNLNGGEIVGITDAMIPNTITLDNINQITTRNFSDMQGLIGLETQSNYGNFIKWRCGGNTGTGTLNLIASGNGSLTSTYNVGTGEGTATINVPTCYGETWRTTTYEIVDSNTWYNLGLDGTATSSNVTYGTATMTVGVSGTYQISGHVSFRDCVNGICRIIKNWSTEVKGTVLSGNTANVTWITVTIPPTIVSLDVNDTVGLQVGCDTPAGTPEIDFVSSGNLPDPTTTIYATLSLVRIGN